MNQKGLPRIDLSSIKKILLIRLRRIGDVIMTTPAISALRDGFPQATLSYVIEEPYRELVEANPDLDKIIVLPENQSQSEFIKIIHQIRSEKYDTVLDFHGGPTASLITFFSKARLKIGYRVKFRHFIYHIKVPRNPRNGPVHSVENHLNLVKALGINIDPSPPLNLPQARTEEVEKVVKFISENKLEQSTIIALHISAGNEFRDWGVENWAHLISLLSQHKGVQVVLIGDRKDKETEEKIQKKSTASFLSLIGKLNLREVKEFISHSSLFVGPDSGPMHIAASTSTPIIALFGPTLPVHFSPWQAEVIVVEKDYDCRPCKQRHCIYNDFRCLRGIKPGDVYEACLKYILEKSPNA